MYHSRISIQRSLSPRLSLLEIAYTTSYGTTSTSNHAQYLSTISPGGRVILVQLDQATLHSIVISPNSKYPEPGSAPFARNWRPSKTTYPGATVAARKETLYIRAQWLSLIPFNLIRLLFTVSNTRDFTSNPTHTYQTLLHPINIQKLRS